MNISTININAIQASLDNMKPHFTVSIQTVIKNNHTCEGLLMRRDGDDIGAIFYPESIKNFEQLGYDEIAKTLFNFANTERPFNVTADALINADFICEHAFIKLMNISNREWLESEDIVYDIITEELCAVYSLEIPEDYVGIATANIKWKQLDSADLDVDEMREYAFENTYRHAEIKSMSDTIRELIGEDIPEFMLPEDDLMYVVSNQFKIWGAGVILSERVRKQIYNKFGGDYWVLPSSIHEVLCIPVRSGNKLPELLAIVKDVNDTQVSTLDRLGYNVLKCVMEKSGFVAIYQA